MALNYVGSINLGLLSPLSLSVSGSLIVSLRADLQVLLDLVLAINVVPPTIALQIEFLIQFAANLTIALEITPPLPYIDLQLGLMVDVILSLTLELSLMLPFSLALDLGAEAGLFVYAYNGTGANFGAAVTAAIPAWPNGKPLTAPSNAMIVATVSPTVWMDVESFFDIITPNLPAGLTYVANANLGLMCGLAVKSTGPLIAELKARLKGAIALSASLNITIPTVALSLVACLELLAALEAALEIGLPDFTFQLRAIAKATAALEARLALLLKFSLSMSGGGAYVYTYDGPGSGLGPSLTSALASGWPGGARPTLPANALVVGTVTPEAWTGLQAFFGGL